jgi:hypothetical protein
MAAFKTSPAAGIGIVPTRISSFLMFNVVAINVAVPAVVNMIPAMNAIVPDGGTLF